MSYIVRVKNLHKQYDPPQGVIAVKDVSFDIQDGEIFSLLGPNGAGKTTIISILSCLLSPTSGEVVIDNHSLIKAPQKIKQVIGVVPQDIALYPNISARENLVFWGKMYGLYGKRLDQRVEALLDLVELADRSKSLVEKFSGGMKRRLNMAVGLLHGPKILFLDEPTVGVDPQSRRRLLDTIKVLAQQGTTILYTTHYMEEAQELSDRIGIIDHGELIALGTLEELVQLMDQHDTILLDLDTNGQDMQNISKTMAELPGIHQVSEVEGHFVLQAREASAVLSNVVAYATQNGMQIRRLEIQEPNLEAIFLHLTGRALRD